MDGQQDQRETKWLRTAEAASLARVSRWTLWRAAVADELPSADLAGERFFAVADVAEWAVARQAVADARPHGDTTTGGT
jgi:hypothetical protein